MAEKKRMHIITKRPEHPAGSSGGVIREHWVRLGFATQLPDGRIVGTIDVDPKWPWDGTFLIAETKPKEDRGAKTPPEDDIPF